MLKRAIKILIVSGDLLTATSCERDIHPIKTKPFLLFPALTALLSVLFLPALSAAQIIEQKKPAIGEFIARADKTFEKSKKVFTVQEKRKNRKFAIEESNYGMKKGEFLIREFSYSMNEKDIEKLAVHYRIGKFSSEENYYFRNKQLVYASERHFYKAVDEAYSVWSGVFYFENEELFDYGTNGHGKSEEDAWKPEKEVLQMSRKRLEQLNKYLARK